MQKNGQHACSKMDVARTQLGNSIDQKARSKSPKETSEHSTLIYEQHERLLNWQLTSVKTGCYSHKWPNIDTGRA